MREKLLEKDEDNKGKKKFIVMKKILIDQNKFKKVTAADKMPY